MYWSYSMIQSIIPSQINPITVMLRKLRTCPSQMGNGQSSKFGVKHLLSPNFDVYLDILVYGAMDHKHMSIDYLPATCILVEI